MTLDQLQRMARAVEANWRHAWASLGAARAEPPTLVDDTPEFLRVYTPTLSETLLNLVMGYSVPEGGDPVSVADIERVLTPYRAHRLTLQWWLLLGDEPAGLREALRASGMRSWGGVAAMAASLVEPEPFYTPPPQGIELRRVTTEAEGDAALAVISEVFFIASGPMRRWSLDNPAFRVYVANWNGLPAAALATLVAGETVGVYHVATRSGARRRGIAGNLVRFALREARDAGCTLAALTATPEGRHLYEQLGFRACGSIEQWLPGYRLTVQLTRGSAEYEES